MKKTIVILMVLVMTLMLCCGCASQPVDNGEDAQNGTVSSQTPATTGGQTADPESKTGLTAELVATVSNEWKNWKVQAGGVVYEDSNGLRGIMSADGKVIGEAKYVYCSGIEENFQVATEAVDAADIASYNRFGVVNANGEMLIPMQYAYIRVINERYYYISEVTGTTENKDEALLYGTDFPYDVFGQQPDDDKDILLTGKWYVYDVIAGKTVEGATGTKPYATRGYGNLLEYFTDTQEQIIVNQDNKKVPEGAVLLDNGCYLMESDDESTVYDSDHNELFVLRADEFSLQKTAGAIPVYEQYIVARNHEQKYLLLDMQGNAISATFDSSITDVCGELICVGNQICDFAGNVVYEGEIQNMSIDQQWGQAWLLQERTDDGYGYTMIDKSGTVLCRADNVNTDKFTASIKEQDQTMWYCLADKDFTLEGTLAVGPWLIANTTETVHEYDLIDTISGETLLSGHQNGYQSVAVPGSAIYVYARNADNALEIYAVK